MDHGDRRFDPVWHGWLCPRVSAEENALYLLPRDHTKSVTGVVCGTVQEILRDRNVSIMLASRTTTRSRSSMQEIKQHLENPVLTWLFPDALYKDPKKASNSKKTVWSQDQLRVKRSVIRSDETVFVGSVGKSITGYHPDIIQLDDILNEEDVVSEAQTNRLKRWWEYLQPIASGSARFKIFGTRYSRDDLYGDIIRLSEKNKFNIRVWQRATKETNGKPDINGEFIYSYFTERILNEKRTGMSEAAFMAQYFNRIIEDLTSGFNMDLVRGYFVLPGAMEMYEWICTVDPAFGGLDNTGICVCGYDRNNFVWVDKAYRFNGSIVEMVKELYRLSSLYPNISFGIEKGHWTEAIEDIYQYILIHENREALSITPVQLSKELNAKHNRIMRMASYLENENVKFKEDVVDEDTNDIVDENTKDLKVEMYYYAANSRQHDDVVDAFSMQPEMHIWGDERQVVRKQGRPRVTYRELLFGRKEQGKDYGYY